MTTLELATYLDDADRVVTFIERSLRLGVVNASLRAPVDTLLAAMRDLPPRAEPAIVSLRDRCEKVADRLPLAV